MGKGRLEAFSDGVIAILITIMVLDLHVPHGSDWAAIQPVLPIFGMYVLSFAYLAIYWNNHHHMLSLVHRVGGGVLWANMHLLFWLSLVPFVTRWMGENNFDSLPVAVYGGVLFMAGAAYYILEHTVIRAQGADTRLRDAVGRDVKGWMSNVLYAVAIALAFPARSVSLVLYAAVALIWLVPDRRIERAHQRGAVEAASRTVPR
jgi:uncharacterized membrane protein